jgi:propanediol dehydratase large subunit
LQHLNSTGRILERVGPLETVLIAEGSITLSSPASSAPVTQIVNVNTSEICPALRIDMDLVRQVLAQQNENNTTFTGYCMNNRAALASFWWDVLISRDFFGYRVRLPNYSLL